MNEVKKHNIRYSVFVTLEKEGNSGVSDKMRYFLIKESDEVILMSYFACTFEEQKEWLLPYLKYADSIGKFKQVKIALLLGGKSVGREISCELNKFPPISDLIKELHSWASNNFKSYAGIVLETNNPLPKSNVIKINKDIENYKDFLLLSGLLLNI